MTNNLVQLFATTPIALDTTMVPPNLVGKHVVIFSCCGHCKTNMELSCWIAIIGVTTCPLLINFVEKLDELKYYLLQLPNYGGGYPQLYRRQ